MVKFYQNQLYIKVLNHYYHVKINKINYLLLLINLMMMLEMFILLLIHELTIILNNNLHFINTYF